VRWGCALGMCVGFELFQGWQMSTMDFTDYAAQKIQAGVGERPAMATKEKSKQGLMLVEKYFTK